MVRLQERDYQVMRLCYEQRFLTREHLASFFGHFTASYRRLWALEESGLVKRERGGAAESAFIIRLTPFGERKVQQKYGICFPPLKAPNLNTLYHDALVTSVRLRLSEIWKDAKFVPERAIQAKEFPEIPDGIFFFPSGKGVAIEVECSDKGKTRFFEKVRRLGDTSAIGFVLYICPNRSMHKSVLRYLMGIPGSVALGVVSWADLQMMSPLIQTKDGAIDARNLVIHKIKVYV